MSNTFSRGGGRKFFQGVAWLPCALPSYEPGNQKTTICVVFSFFYQRFGKAVVFKFHRNGLLRCTVHISQTPHTNTVTPMHQDEGYWLDMPDKRAVSVWVALDDATKENGCMCFIPGSHKTGLLTHRPAKGGHHVLCCDGNEVGLSKLIFKKSVL